MGKLHKPKKGVLLVATFTAAIGIFILTVVLSLYGNKPDSKKILEYMEWEYKKDFQITDEFTYISYTDGEPDTQRELKCPAVVLQDKENKEIRFIAYAKPFETGDWIYQDNYSQKLLLYCIKQEQIEINNEAECEADDAFVYPVLMLEHTEETAQKLQNMTIRFNELYQYDLKNNYVGRFGVEGSLYLYSVEAGNISDRWLDETGPFCYDTPIEKYEAFLDKLE